MKSKIYSSLFFMLALLAACSENLLDKQDPGSGSVENFFNNEEELVLGINGIYNALQGDFWGGAFIHIQPEFDQASDNALGCCPWGWGYPQIADGSFNSSTGAMASWKWDFGFQAISRVNQMLEIIATGVPGLEASKASRWEAELKFIRGYIYFEMSFVHGDVPLITTVLTPDEAAQLTRTAKSEVVATAIDDLTFAANNLETTPNDGQLGRPTKQAALTMLGKLYLYNEQFANAASTFNQVIALEGSAVGLDPDYTSLFNGTNETSPEIIWSLQAVSTAMEGSYVQVQYGIPGTATFNGWNGMAYPQSLIDDYYCTDGLPITESPLYDPANPYENRDLRLRGSFYIPGDVWNGITLESQRHFIWVNGLLSDLANAAEVLTRKWVQTTELDQSDIVTSSGVDLVLLRYADVLLMYAEAQNEAVGPDASVYAAINKVRARAGVADIPAGLTKDQMRDEIRHERRVEFVMEGTRYFDLLRWRIAETVIPSNPLGNYVFDPNKNYLWPIPQSAIDVNPGITQNPGY